MNPSDFQLNWFERQLLQMLLRSPRFQAMTALLFVEQTLEEEADEQELRKLMAEDTPSEDDRNWLEAMYRRPCAGYENEWS